MKEKLKNNLQNDEFELVKGEKKIKFFVVDLMGKVREYLMQKIFGAVCFCMKKQAAFPFEL